MDEASCLSPNSYFSPAARMPNFRGASGRCAATSFSCVLRGWAHPRRMLDVLAVRAPGLPVPPGRLMGDGRVLLGGIGQRQPRQPERSSRQQTRFAPCQASANGSVNAKPMGPRLSQLRQRATATHSDTSKANASSLLHRHGLTVTTRGLAEAEPNGTAGGGEPFHAVAKLLSGRAGRPPSFSKFTLPVHDRPSICFKRLGA